MQNNESLTSLTSTSCEYAVPRNWCALVGAEGCAPSPRSRSVKAVPEGKQMQGGLSSFFPIFLLSLLVVHALSPSPKEKRWSHLLSTPYFWDQDSGWLSLFCRIMLLRDTFPACFASLALLWQILLLAHVFLLPAFATILETAVWPLGAMAIILIFKLNCLTKYY